MAKAKGEAAQTAEAVVYIGPAVKSGGLHLQPSTIYKGGALPGPLAALCADDAALAALFVPVAGLAASRAQVARVGTILNRAAQAVAAKYRGAKK